MTSIAGHTEAPIFVGGTLASVVAVTERAARGLPSVLVNPGGPLGGYFAGIEAGGRLWDAGMVLYEFTSFREPADEPDIRSYDPMKRNDVGRFCATVRRYVGRHQQTRIVTTPELQLNGQWWPDFLLANRGDWLSKMPWARGALAEIEAGLSSSSPWHPRTKLAWPDDGTDHAGQPLIYDAVSRANHGETVHHELVVPFLRKVMNCEASGLSALYHRMNWAPLYWPETLRGWLADEPVQLPDTEFSHPVGQPVAAMIRTLVKDLRASPLVRVIEDRLLSMRPTARGFTLRLQAQGELQTPELIWAQSPAQGLQAAGLPTAGVDDRLPLMIGLLEVPTSCVQRPGSVQHLLDPSLGIYRVTHSSACADESQDGFVALTVEANPGWFDAVHGTGLSEGEAIDAIMRDLARAGVLASDGTPRFTKLIKLAGALPLPTPRAVQGFLADRAALLSACPGIQLMGPAAGPFANSMSDQIVQGLACGAFRDTALPAMQQEYA
ncbi:hypothetical protein [Piscinibacterium candidicorallinum]